MISEYKIYERKGDRTPIVSVGEISKYQLRGKNSFVGKKAKIEAIFRYSKTRLLSTLTTQQVNDYIAENLYGKPIWNDYYTIFKEVSNEITPMSDIYEFKYTLIAEMDNTITDDNFTDERLIYLLTCELLGQSLEEHDGMKNPIISLKKRY